MAEIGILQEVTLLSTPIDPSTISRDSEICGSLQLPSMGDIDIFAFNSQNNGKIVTFLFLSFSSPIAS